MAELKFNEKVFYKDMDIAILKGNVIVGREVINGAKQLTRVDTGALRDSYTIDPNVNQGKTLEFSNTQPYFGAQEQGTKYIKPTHALIKTIDSRAKQIGKTYLTQIQNEVKNMK